MLAGLYLRLIMCHGRVVLYVRESLSTTVGRIAIDNFGTHINGALGIWLQSVDPGHIIEDVTFEGMRNFDVPVGMRGTVRNIRGLPRGIVRDERDRQMVADGLPQQPHP